MTNKGRRLLMTLIVATTVAWVIVTVLIVAITQELSTGWVLATIILYAALFIVAILLFLAEPIDIGTPPASTRPFVIANPGPEHETVFATRRGNVDVDRTQGAAAAQVVLAERGHRLDLEKAEAALDELRPASGEAGAPTPRALTSRTPPPGIEGTRRPAGRGVEA